MTIELHSNNYVDLIVEKFEKANYSLANFKKSFIQRRINARMRINKITTYEDYLHLLDSTPMEFNSLLQNLSINVTEFFRDQKVFSLLSENIIPNVLEKQHEIKICSAGCASGEEPYTLAIICKELQQNHDFKFKIYAYDRNIDALTKARNGIFHFNSMKNLTKEIREKYFVFQNNDAYLVNKQITEDIQFTQWDLSKILPVNNFDILLCRNVIIYLDTHARQMLFQNFHQVIKKSRYLVIGLSELLNDVSSSLFTPIYPRERIYRQN